MDNDLIFKAEHRGMVRGREDGIIEAASNLIESYKEKYPDKDIKLVITECASLLKLEKHQISRLERINNIG